MCDLIHVVKTFNSVFSVSEEGKSVAALHQGVPGQMACQVKWPGWKIHRPGSSPGSAPPSPAYFFASVIVWTENKNITISDRFICFILTVKRRWRPVFWGRQLKKGRQLFLRKKVHLGDLAGGFTDLEMTWLLPLLRWRWRCHWGKSPDLRASATCDSRLNCRRCRVCGRTPNFEWWGTQKRLVGISRFHYFVSELTYYVSSRTLILAN